VEAVAIDQHLGHQQAGVVGRGLRRAIGAGGADIDQVAGVEDRQVAVVAEIVAGLADRADDIGGQGFARRRAKGCPPQP